MSTQPPREDWARTDGEARFLGTDLPALFLGLAPQTRDDKALLGLAPFEVATRESVLAALRDRLQLVAAHSLAHTPEAAELRMMLHASVARILLSPEMRGAGHANAGQPAGVSLSLSARGSGSPVFDELAPLVLARHGGWNAGSHHELRMLAQVHGVPFDRVADAMSRPVVPALGAQPFASRASGEVSPSPARAATSASSDELSKRARAALAALDARRDTNEQDPGRRLVRNTLVGAGVGLLFLGVGALGLRLMFAGKAATPLGTGNSVVSDAPAHAPDRSAAGGREASPAGGTSNAMAGPAAPREDRRANEPADSAPPMEAFSAIEALVQVRAAASDIGRDPQQASASLVAALDAMARNWTSASVGEVVAAGEAAAEFAYRAGTLPNESRDATLRSLTDLLEAELVFMAPGVSDAQSRASTEASASAWTPDRIRRSTFACGMAARLLRERDLPSTLLVRLRRQLAAALGGSLPSDQATLRQSMVAGLDRIGVLLVGEAGLDGAKGAGVRGVASSASAGQASAEAWTAWSDALAALLASDSPTEQTQVLLLALDRAMTAPSEPSTNPWVASAIDTLARKLPLQGDATAKHAVLRWMTQPGISSLDLHLLTNALVQVPESGLELTATLSAAATESDRQALRERYANLWQIAASEESSTLTQRWLDAARGLLSTMPGPGSKDRLSYALQLSALSTSAELARRGDILGAGRALERASSVVKPWRGSSPAQLGASATSWGDRYLALANDTPKKRELLGQVRSNLSEMEARIIVEEATRGGNFELRKDARIIMQRSIQQAEVVKALLDFAPFIPATRDNQQMLETATGVDLPAIKDATWRVGVRRALLRKLLEMISSEDNASIDLAADYLLTDYRDRIVPSATQASLRDDEQMGKESQTPARDTGEVDDARAEGISTEDFARPQALPQIAEVPRELLASVRSYQAQWAMAAQRGWLADPAFPSVQESARIRDSRLATCDTDMQRFVVEINTLIELQARTLAMEDRASRDAALLVVEAWRRDASASLHVFEQVAAGELAQVRLWMLRLGGDVPGADGQPVRTRVFGAGEGANP